MGTNSLNREMAKQRESDLENAVSDLLGDQVSDKLEQDKFEGVKDEEWDEDDEVEQGEN